MSRRSSKAPLKWRLLLTNSTRLRWVRSMAGSSSNGRAAVLSTVGAHCSSCPSAESAKVGGPAKGNGAKGRCTDALGMLAYFEIKELVDAGKLKPSWDDNALVPYAFDPASKLWVSYDDEKSFGKKMDFIDQKGLGGAMFWALDMDDFHHGFPLVSAVAKRYKK